MVLIWVVSRMGKNSPSYFCDCLMCAQAGVKPSIVMKEKDVFHVLVRANSTDTLSQFVCSFLIREQHGIHVLGQQQTMTNWNKVFVMCSKVEAGITEYWYSVLLNICKCVLKMMETLWRNKTHDCKRCMHQACKFNFYCNYIFFRKNGGIICIPPLKKIVFILLSSDIGGKICLSEM
jgi:hypothetical protein